MHGSLQGYTLIDMPTRAQMEEIFRLRGHAWQSRLPDFPAPSRWEDPEDNECLHWAIRYGGEVVAAARLCLVGSIDHVPNAEVYSGVLPQLTGMIGSFNRLVVHPAHAKKGLSQWLDRERLTYADALGTAHLVGQTFAGMARIAALKALGFRVVGEANAYSHGPLRKMNALLARPSSAASTKPSTVVLLRSHHSHR